MNERIRLSHILLIFSIYLHSHTHTHATGPWYELSLWKSMNPKEHFGSNFGKKKNEHITPFDHVQFHQCSSPQHLNWKWAMSIYDIAKMRSDEGLITDNDTVYSNYGFEPDTTKVWGSDLVFFSYFLLILSFPLSLSFSLSLLTL